MVRIYYNINIRICIFNIFNNNTNVLLLLNSSTSIMIHVMIPGYGTIFEILINNLN